MTMREIDLTETNVNIDNMLDVYVSTQRDNGVDVGMVEVDVDIDCDGHIKRDKFSHEKKECEEGCSSCQKKAKREDTDDIPWHLTNNMGLFGEDASSELDDDNEEDDDGKYICDYCSELGYKKEYKSYICDTCRACETCTEYENGDCDGCTYSMYRTGRLYSVELASIGDTSFLDDDEKRLIEKIEKEDYNDNVMMPDFTFTVMDHDHSFNK